MVQEGGKRRGSERMRGYPQSPCGVYLRRAPANREIVGRLREEDFLLLIRPDVKREVVLQFATEVIRVVGRTPHRFRESTKNIGPLRARLDNAKSMHNGSAVRSIETCIGPKRSF
jgi:hypothetical protein